MIIETAERFELAAALDEIGALEEVLSDCEASVEDVDIEALRESVIEEMKQGNLDADWGKEDDETPHMTLQVNLAYLHGITESCTYQGLYNSFNDFLEDRAREVDNVPDYILFRVDWDGLAHDCSTDYVTADYQGQVAVWHG